MTSWGVQMKKILSVVLDAIGIADDNFTYFLDIETGESVFLVDELITGLDNEGLGGDTFGIKL